MSWGYVAVAAATVVGGKMSSDASKEAAAKQGKSAQAGIEAQERMFERQLELQEPYREAGYEAIQGLQGLTDPVERARLLQEYSLSPEYQALSDAANRNILSTASATGGLRGGATQADLMTVAPQLGLSYLDQLQNQFTGLANLGMGAASQGAQGAQNLGFQTSNLLQQQGQAQAANQLAQANIWGNTLGSLGGIYKDYSTQQQQNEI